MGIFTSQSELLNHLAEYAMLTDDEILTRSSNDNGLDACEALLLHAERDFCKSCNDTIVDKLKHLNQIN